jgi:predicted RNase H-like HicB family nuclease
MPRPYRYLHGRTIVTCRRITSAEGYIQDWGANLREFKIIVEKHSDGYVAYPLGLKGVVVWEGESYEEALADVKSAISFHIETFGQDGLDEELQ